MGPGVVPQDHAVGGNGQLLADLLGQRHVGRAQRDQDGEGERGPDFDDAAVVGEPIILEFKVRSQGNGALTLGRSRQFSAHLHRSVPPGVTAGGETSEIQRKTC